MEHTVPVFLHHLCMNVETGITELGDFLGQELNPLSGVTEDDGLIDLKLNRKKKKVSVSCLHCGKICGFGGL